MKAETHHKVVVLGRFCHEIRRALPNADLHIPSVLAHLSFTHLTHDPANKQ